MRYATTAAPRPADNDGANGNDPQGNRPDLDRGVAETAAHLMSQSSEKPVILPEDPDGPEDADHETVRARSRQGRQGTPSSRNRAPGTVFFFVAEP